MKCRLGVFLAIFVLFNAVDGLAQKAIPLSGALNFNENKVLMKFGEGEEPPVHLEVKEHEDNFYDVELSFLDWNMPFFTVTTILKGSLKILKDDKDQSYAIGKMKSSYTLLNNRSFGEISADVVVDASGLIIKSFNIGPFYLTGKVLFFPSQKIDLILRFSDVPMLDVFGVFKKGVMLDVEGDVSGDLKLTGSSDQLQIRGSLVSYGGSVVGYDYDMARLNISGVYPEINVSDSYVAQSDGFSFEVSGSLDLSKLENFGTQIKEFTGAPLVEEDSHGLEWTLKRLETGDDGVTTEFKYMLRKNDNEGDALIGIERKIQF